MGEVWVPDQDKPVSLAAWFRLDPLPEKRLGRLKMMWRDDWKVLDVTFNHAERRGKTLVHHVSAFDGTRYYRFEYDSKRLVWTLTGVFDSE